MSKDLTQAHLTLIKETYLESIRTAVFVDDEFPRVGVKGSNEEGASIATSLAAFFCDKGWICDFESRKNGPKLVERLLAADIAIIDYHLEKEDHSFSLNLISQLATKKHENSCIAVLFTNETNKTEILEAIAKTIFCKQQTSQPSEVAVLPEDDAGNDTKALLAHIRSRDETWLGQEGLSLNEKIQLKEFSIEKSWILGDGLLVIVVTKPLKSNLGASGSTLYDGIAAAMTDLAPSLFSCLTSKARLEVKKEWARWDFSAVHADAEDALIQYIVRANEADEKTERSRELTLRLIERRFDRVLGLLTEEIQKQLADHKANDSNETSVNAANAYLSSKRFDGKSVTTGTVLKFDDGTYVAVATPACDLVSYRADQQIKVIALELELGKREVPFSNNSHVFFLEDNSPVIASVRKGQRPHTTSLLLLNQGRVDDTGNARVIRLGENLKAEMARPISQLRSPYAEHLSQMVGTHLTRIGLNFVEVKRSKK